MVIFLSNKDVSSRVSQAGEKLGIVSIITHTPPVLCVTARQHRGIRGERGNSAPPAFSALGTLHCRLLNVLVDVRVFSVRR